MELDEVPAFACTLRMLDPDLGFSLDLGRLAPQVERVRKSVVQPRQRDVVLRLEQERLEALGDFDHPRHALRRIEKQRDPGGVHLEPRRERSDAGRCGLVEAGFEDRERTLELARVHEQMGAGGQHLEAGRISGGTQVGCAQQQLDGCARVASRERASPCGT